MPQKRFSQLLQTFVIFNFSHTIVSIRSITLIMAGNSCSHPDVRKFDGIRCCLACGEAVFEATKPETTAVTVTANKYTEYEYIDLKYQLGQEIRLAVLLPGAREDPLRAEIIHVNLEDRPEYDAISYTWATEDEDTSLSGVVECLQGGSIKITRNCDAVLRQLRQRGLRRNIWIDAICMFGFVHKHFTY